MKYCFIILLLWMAMGAGAQDSAAIHAVHYHTYERYAVNLDLTFGVADVYRHTYPLATGFVKSNTTGFAPVSFMVDYGVSKSVSIAAAFSYDAFRYNIQQMYTGNNGPFTRYVSNNTRVLSEGLRVYYHLGKVIHVNRLDPFAGLGVTLNNIRYGAYPQGDSTVIKFEHTVTPFIKAGVRYHITPYISAMADVGYDQHSIVDLGVSCRFFRKRKMM